MDAMMVPTNREEHTRSPHRSFKIKPDFGSLRIGICEPTIWKVWRKSGRINADAERFMVCWWTSAYVGATNTRYFAGVRVVLVHTMLT
jgi:hypothetical protein